MGSFRKKAMSRPAVRRVVDGNLERWRHKVSSAKALDPFESIEGAIELALKGSLVAGKGSGGLQMWDATLGLGQNLLLSLFLSKLLAEGGQMLLGLGHQFLVGRGTPTGLLAGRERPQAPFVAHGIGKSVHTIG